MKIKELIKELSEYDPEMEVYIDEGPYCFGYGPAERLYVGRENGTDGAEVLFIEAGDADEETGE